MLTARTELDLNTERITGPVVKIGNNTGLECHVKDWVCMDVTYVNDFLPVHETSEIVLATVKRLVATNETRTPVVADPPAAEEMLLFAQGFTDAGMKLIWPGET